MTLTALQIKPNPQTLDSFTRIQEVPVDKIVVKEVPLPIEVPVQTVVEKEVVKEVYIDRVVTQEVPVYVEKIVEKEVPVYVDKIVEKEVRF